MQPRPAVRRHDDRRRFDRRRRAVPHPLRLDRRRRSRPIIRSQSLAHATAIACRDNLSVQVVDALVERRQTAAVVEKPAEVSQDTALPTAIAVLETAPANSDAAAVVSREEQLRNELKALARASSARPAADPPLAPIGALQEALLVRLRAPARQTFSPPACQRRPGASIDLAERILLDISGQQLAVTLTALAMPRADALFVLSALYPHLQERLRRDHARRHAHRRP